MNWLTKLSQRSGYCDFQLLPVDRYNFESRDKVRQQIRKAARTEAEDMACSKGHNLTRWDSMDKTWCRDCGRRMELFARGNRSNLMARGKALTEDCHEPHSYWQDVEDHFRMKRLDIN